MATEPLSDAERKVLVEVLDRACTEFSNHGCNDFHLKDEADLSGEEIAEIQARLANWNKDPLQETDTKNPYTQDWMLLAFFRDRIKEGA